MGYFIVALCYALLITAVVIRVPITQKVFQRVGALQLGILFFLVTMLVQILLLVGLEQTAFFEWSFRTANAQPTPTVQPLSPRYSKVRSAQRTEDCTHYLDSLEALVDAYQLLQAQMATLKDRHAAVQDSLGDQVVYYQEVVNTLFEAKATQ